MGSGIRVLFVATGIAVATNAGCAADDACERTATCAATAPSTAAALDGGPDAALIYPEVAPPAGCEPLADPKSMAPCVDDTYALFVDGASGFDANPGSQRSPLRTLAEASKVDRLMGRPRIYACAGTYDASVALPPGVSLVGGYACGGASWAPAAAPTRLAPRTPGPVVRTLSRSPKTVLFSDLEVAAPDGVLGDESSIGFFVSATAASFLRVTITTGKGRAADRGQSRVNTGGRPDPKPGEGPTGGAGAEHRCALSGVTRSGAGGAAGAKGGDGTSTPPSTTAGGGSGGTCSDGANGGAGADGSAAPPPTTFATITENGWEPVHGASGIDAAPGGGGGGGGGGPAAGGGAGGLGGCGGAGGGGGRAGGSSIGIVGFQCAIAVVETSITTGSAGSGGDGAEGESFEDGQDGSKVGACKGGKGGPGGGGGGGGGGAGGLAIGVARAGGSFEKGPGSFLFHGGNGAGGEGGPGGLGATLVRAASGSRGVTPPAIGGDDLEL